MVGEDPRAEGYSGADLAALVHEAGIAVLKEIRRKEQQEGVRYGAKSHQHSAATHDPAPPTVRC